MKKKIAPICTIACFLLIVGGLFLANLITPDRSFSELENRYLEQRPTFRLETLFSGEFTSDFETWTSDQFVGRDLWVALKSACEQLSGKRENNGVYLMEGETLAERYDAPDPSRVDKNTAAVEKLAELLDLPVYLTLIPGSIKVWEDRLPYGAPVCDQKEVIDGIAGSLSSAQYIDTYSALTAHRDEEIFYRTDHHWTTLGAYYGYAAAVEAMGLTPAPLGEGETVSDSFYGTAFSRSGVRFLAPDRIIAYPAPEAEITIFDGGEEGRPGAFYVPERLDTVDQYAYFLGGNDPLVTIRTGIPDAPRLLLIKDSYANSELPFLAQSFSEIVVVDLRYNKTPITQYVEQYSPDMVLVSYSVANFTSDANIPLMAR